ncbi:FecR family protein [Mangrovibacterium lignilyticum]|uniref:FecR family protein n=1 Tax=Mangrovibacterium lignilyticum TaxID=2668052 RepID=UPI0013D78FA0|nr:FecR domain-containing protein [Mangrovibacterium lignilyticum]
MKNLKDYIEDPRFIRWTMDNDVEASAFYQKYMEEHPEEKAALIKAHEELLLLAVRNKSVSEKRKDAIYRNILAQKTIEQEIKTRLLYRKLLPYAAVALVFFSLGSLIMKLTEQVNPHFVSEQLLVKSAANNTTIYLADGSKKEVSNSDLLIDFVSDRKLILGNDTLVMSATGSENRVNMVVVPYGKRARVGLPDKSQVQLTAGSRILIPEHFSRTDRSAYLLGEAFFDVSKDPDHPFFLNTILTEIKVLGTSFRVQAYADLPEQRTFLSEGKVMIRNAEHSVLAGWTEMKPNQEALTNGATGNTRLVKGDQKAYSSWKKGILEINEEPLVDVIDKVEHYFNITIQIPDPQIQSRVMSGKLNLNAELNEVFEYLENITDGKVNKISAGEYELN